MPSEVQVYRLNDFEKDKDYAFALKTRTEGKWPNETHYSSNPLQILGKHIGSKRWGYMDNAGGSEMFVHDDKVTEITYDYAGLTCFVKI